jgi:hypothetical protein
MGKRIPGRPRRRDGARRRFRYQHTNNTPATVRINPNPVAIHQATTRQYLLKPVSAQAVYERRGKKEPRDDSKISAQRIHLRIDSVGATLTSSHLRAVYATLSASSATPGARRTRTSAPTSPSDRRVAPKFGGGSRVAPSRCDSRRGASPAGTSRGPPRFASIRLSTRCAPGGGTWTRTSTARS